MCFAHCMLGSMACRTSLYTIAAKQEFYDYVKGIELERSTLLVYHTVFRA